MVRSAAAKKVAKAASAGVGGRGGRGFRARRNLLFPASMLLVVALGVVLILVARSERAANAPSGPPRIGDHWHSLYEIYDCDDFIDDLYPNDVDDFTGIHTHGDRLIHIHPFVSTVTGQFATVGAFMREIEFDLDDSRIELPDGSFLDEAGPGCPSPDPDSDDPAVAEPAAELRILRWETLQAEKALAFTEDLQGVRFLGDGQIFVFAFVHPSVDNDDIPRPDDSFLRSYLNLPPEDQPLLDDISEGPEAPTVGEVELELPDSGGEGPEAPTVGEVEVELPDSGEVGPEAPTVGEVELELPDSGEVGPEAPVVGEVEVELPDSGSEGPEGPVVGEVELQLPDSGEVELQLPAPDEDSGPDSGPEGPQAPAQSDTPEIADSPEG